MKVKVKNPFYDDKGIHKIGDVLEVEEFNEFLMEKLEEKKPETKKRAKG